MARPLRLLRLPRLLPPLLLLALGAMAFVVVSALLGAKLGSPGKTLLGGAAVLLAPLLLRLWLRRRVERRVGAPPLGGRSVLLLWNLALLVLLGLGFSNATGRALRRRGDWFLGEADGWLADRLRRGIVVAAGWMERFDLPPPLRPSPAIPPVAPVAPPSPVAPRPPSPPTEPQPPPADPGRWVHPLDGPIRVVARYAIQRFGAPRGGRQPVECEGGHCGIDLERPRGAPVHAVHDGVVLKLVRAETRGRGRYLQLAHRDGEVRTAYLHLDTIRDGLQVGSTVSGGSVIGTVGSSGLTRGGAHLHFELAIRTDEGSYRFVDPERILASWPLPGGAPAIARLGPPLP